MLLQPPLFRPPVGQQGCGWETNLSHKAANPPRCFCFIHFSIKEKYDSLSEAKNLSVSVEFLTGHSARRAVQGTAADSSAEHTADPSGSARGSSTRGPPNANQMPALAGAAFKAERGRLARRRLPFPAPTRGRRRKRGPARPEGGGERGGLPGSGQRSGNCPVRKSAGFSLRS